MKQVVLANLNDGSVRSEFLRSVVALLLHDTAGARRLAGMVINTGGPNLGMRRNEGVRDFLQSGNEWLLFLDSDIVFLVDLLDRLAKHADAAARPILAANHALATTGGIVPATYRWQAQGAGRTLAPFTPDADSAACVEVDGTAAGCLLVHRGALLRMAEVHSEPLPWFGDYIQEGLLMGEDLGFCCRARAAGLPIHVVAGLGVQHVKPHLLAEPSWLAAAAGERPAVIAAAH